MGKERYKNKVSNYGRTLLQELEVGEGNCKLYFWTAKKIINNKLFKKKIEALSAYKGKEKKG